VGERVESVRERARESVKHDGIASFYKQQSPAFDKETASSFSDTHLELLDIVSGHSQGSDQEARTETESRRKEED
jgi:hypothetical protein